MAHGRGSAEQIRDSSRAPDTRTGMTQERVSICNRTKTESGDRASCCHPRVWHAPGAMPREESRIRTPGPFAGSHARG